MLKTIALLALLAFTGVCAGTGEVVILNPDNFDSIVKDSSKNVFVKFFAPWCGHCVRMAPTWKELAADLKGNNEVVIAELDADQYGDLAGRYGVQGFPTLKYFPKDNKDGLEYEGGRDLSQFKSYLNVNPAAADEAPKAAVPSTAVPGELAVLNPDNFDSIVKDPTKTVFVKFFAPWCGHCVRMADAWKELAKGMKDRPDIVIAELDADAHGNTARSFGVRGFPTLKLFTKTDKTGDKKYEGARDLASWQAFLQENA